MKTTETTHHLKQHVILLLFGFCALFAFGFIGCGDDDDDDVQAANTPPVIDALNLPGDATVDETLTFEVIAHDPDGDALTYQWFDLTQGSRTPLGITTSTAKWMAAAEGEVVILVEVSYGQARAKREGLIRIARPLPERPSSFGSLPDQMVGVWVPQDSTVFAKRFLFYQDGTCNLSLDTGGGESMITGTFELEFRRASSNPAASPVGVLNISVTSHPNVIPDRPHLNFPETLIFQVQFSRNDSKIDPREEFADAIDLTESRNPGGRSPKFLREVHIGDRIFSDAQRFRMVRQE